MPTCDHCSEPFTPYRQTQVYCCVECKRAANAQRQREKRAGSKRFCQGIAATPPQTDAEEKALTKLIYKRAEELREKRTYNYHPQGKGRIPADVTLVELGARRGRVG